DDVDIADIISNHAQDLETAAQALIDAANKAGGRDNVSAILMKVHAVQIPKQGVVSRFLKWLK
ncbi:MAG: protein phosphatase, partial [Burkholderiales bacterium]|nr:protein phosphatase [Burkholderiales bacterium]